MRTMGMRGVVLVLGSTLVPLACATGGDNGGGIGGDDGGGGGMDTSQTPTDSGGEGETGSSSSSSGGGLDGSSSSSSSGGTQDSGNPVDTGGPPVDSSSGGGCSLLSMSPCAPGAVCCPMNNMAVCMCTAGTGTQGSSCTNACAAGYVCAVQQGATTGNCYQWCTIPNGSCPSGTMCTALAMPPVINGVTYGFCH